MNETIVAHLLAITEMRQSDNIDTVRELGRIFAVKYFNLVKAVQQAQQEYLSVAEPHELATVESVFGIIARLDEELIKEALPAPALDEDGQV